MGDKKTYTLLAPTGGVDYASAINRLPDMFAQELVNVYPDDGVCKLRNGFTTFFDTARSAGAKTVTSLVKADGTEILVYVADNDIYKLVSGVATDIGDTTNDELQTVSFGYKLFGVNGADTPWYWDGATATVTSAGFSGSGLTVTNLINVSTYRERLYFVEKNTGNIWYTSTVKAITGTLTKFDADYILKKGGSVIACGGYTNSHGTNIEDLFYILSSQGELIFYTGNSPAAQDWRIVAIFQIGKPLGYRANLQAGNDLYFITNRGIESCNELFSGITANSLSTLGRNINKLIRQYARELPFSYLWQMAYYANGSRIYLTLPDTTFFNKLLVLNTNTKAWSVYDYNYGASDLGKFHAIHINAGLPITGSATGKIVSLESGQTDGGEDINFEIYFGHNYFNSQQFKRFTEIRPLIKTASGVTLEVSIITDYNEAVASTNIQTSGAFTPWGSAWYSHWSSPVQTKYDRYGLSGSGHSAALKFSGSVSNAPIDFYAFEISFEDGVRR